jgi:hypothetical protein
MSLNASRLLAGAETDGAAQRPPGQCGRPGRQPNLNTRIAEQSRAGGIPCRRQVKMIWPPAAMA